MVTHVNRGTSYSERLKKSSARTQRFVKALKKAGKIKGKNVIINKKSYNVKDVINKGYTPDPAIYTKEELQTRGVEETSQIVERRQQLVERRQQLQNDARVVTAKKTFVARTSGTDVARTSGTDIAKSSNLNPSSNNEYFVPKNNTSSLKNDSKKSVVTGFKAVKSLPVDKFIFGASQKISEFDKGTQKTISNIENFYSTKSSLGKYLSKKNTFASKLALKTITAVPSGIVGTIGGGISAIGKIGVSAVAVVGGRGKEVKAEFSRTTKLFPKSFQEKFVTIDDGKVSFTPDQVVTIGAVVVGTAVGGAIRGKVRNSQVKTSSVKTSSQVSKNVKGRVLGTEKGIFQNVKGQKFTYKTSSTIPKKVLTSTKDGVKTYTQNVGNYKTTIYDSAGKVVKTKTGTIKPTLIKKNVGTDVFIEKTSIKPSNGFSKNLKETGSRSVISKDVVGKRTFTTSIVDKKSSFGFKKTQTIGLKKTQTFGDTTKTIVFPKTSSLKFSNLKNLGKQVKTIGSKVKSTTIKMLADKKGTSTFGVKPNSNVGNFNTDFNFFKPASSKTSFSTSPKLNRVVSQSPLISRVVLSSPTPPSFVPFVFNPNSVKVPVKTPASVKPFSIPQNQPYFSAKPLNFSIPKDVPVNEPEGGLLPRPMEQIIVQPITQPDFRLISSNRQIYEPTPPTPSIPIPTPSVVTIFSTLPIIPFIPIRRSMGSLGSSFSFKNKSNKKRKKSFKPTIRSSAFNIKGTTRKGAEFTGLGERFAKKKKF
jgi:hypothetical protein